MTGVHPQNKVEPSAIDLNFLTMQFGQADHGRPET
jgi:hypothetical protein